MNQNSPAPSLSTECKLSQVARRALVGKEVILKCCLNCFRIFIVDKTIGLEVTLVG